MPPVAQEAGIIELDWEQLEGIQGGRGWRWFFRQVTDLCAQLAEVIGDTIFNSGGSGETPGA